MRSWPRCTLPPSLPTSPSLRTPTPSPSTTASCLAFPPVTATSPPSGRLSGTRPVASGPPAATGARRPVSSSPPVPPVVARSLPPSLPCPLWLTTASSMFPLVTPRPSPMSPTLRRFTVAPPGVPVPLPAPLVPASPPSSSSESPLPRARLSLRLSLTDYMVARRRTALSRLLLRPTDQRPLRLLLLRHQSRSLSRRERMARTASVVCQ